MASPRDRRTAGVRLLAVAAALAVALAACGSSGGSNGSASGSGGTSPKDKTEIEGLVRPHPLQVGDVPYTEVAADGTETPFTFKASPGKLLFVAFGYTNCPDVCPTVLAEVAMALSRLDASVRQQLQLIFVTTDPARDTPAVLKTFVSAFYPRMIGLTGDAAAIRRVADDYRVFYEKQPVQPGGGYLVQHSDHAILFGPDGKPITLVPVKDTPEAIAATLEQWVR